MARWRDAIWGMVPDEVLDVVRRSAMLVKLLINTLVDLAFVVVWARVNHWADGLLMRTHVEDEFALATIKRAFAAATMFPIMTFVLVDIIRISRSIWQSVLRPPRRRVVPDENDDPRQRGDEQRANGPCRLRRG